MSQKYCFTQLKLEKGRDRVEETAFDCAMEKQAMPHLVRTLSLLIFAFLPSIVWAVSPEQIERHLVGTWLVAF